MTQPTAVTAADRPEDLLGEGGPWRVLVVDDRPERRALMRVVLGTEPPLGRTEVVVTEATGSVAATQPDTLTRGIDAAIIEVQPVEVGLAAIEALRTACPSMVIVVCSFHLDKATQLQASLAGADAYLPKPVSRRELVAACRSTYERATRPAIPVGSDGGRPTTELEG